MSKSSTLESFAHALLRGSGWGCVLDVQAHFDESGTHSSQLTVAGYVFEADRFGAFCHAWTAHLATHHLPYMHMTDFAPENGSLAIGLDKDARSRLIMKLMGLIKAYSIFGVVANIKNDRKNRGESYSSAVRKATSAVAKWAEVTGYNGSITYFFEAGATGHGLVDEGFASIARDPAASAHYRYAGHDFIGKIANPGVQAADLLAWLYHNFTKGRKTQNLARLDLRALLRHPHSILDECGEAPRESRFQSIKESRNRLETIFYLPTVTYEQAKRLTVLVCGKDGPTIRGGFPGQMLACPNCYRVVCEDQSWMNIENIVIRCWCGTLCNVPSIIVPFASRRGCL